MAQDTLFSKKEDDMRTVFGGGDGKIEHGGYGALTFAYTTIDGESALLLGGRGGWLINHRFTLAPDGQEERLPEIARRLGVDARLLAEGIRAHGHRQVIFADDFGAARKVLADDFSLYLHRPTATDPSLAPPGCDGAPAAGAISSSIISSSMDSSISSCIVSSSMDSSISSSIISSFMN